MVTSPISVVTQWQQQSKDCLTPQGVNSMPANNNHISTSECGWSIQDPDVRPLHFIICSETLSTFVAGRRLDTVYDWRPEEILQCNEETRIKKAAKTNPKTKGKHHFSFASIFVCVLVCFMWIYVANIGQLFLFYLQGCNLHFFAKLNCTLL